MPSPDHPSPNRPTVGPVPADCAPVGPSLSAKPFATFGPIVVTLDGPSGCGKTSLAAELARALGGVALHTGRHYRSVTLAAQMAGVMFTETGVAAFLESAGPRLDSEGRLVLSGVAFAEREIEAASMDALVSQVANMDPVRERLIALQRAWVASAVGVGTSVVVDGRDAGTRIAPDATLRVYLHASAAERAARRHTQRAETTHDAATTLAEILRRDEADVGHDRTTLATPGVKPVETDGVSPSQVLATLWNHIELVTASQPGITRSHDRGAAS